MGVEHSGFCHDCKEWIDCHKCYAADNLVRHAEERDLIEPTGYKDFKYWGENIGYWGARLLWFLLKHRKHNTEVLTDHDGDGRMFRLEDEYKEVLSYSEMNEQRDRLPESER